MNPSYNPASVMLGQGSSKPYVNYGAEAVRATGQGPYDSAYRQNLATYAGGGFQRPGGYLGFNPTGQLPGNPTGTGSAPVQGAPTDLLSMALTGTGRYAPSWSQQIPTAPLAQPLSLPGINLGSASTPAFTSPVQSTQGPAKKTVSTGNQMSGGWQQMLQGLGGRFPTPLGTPVNSGRFPRIM